MAFRRALPTRRQLRQMAPSLLWLGGLLQGLAMLTAAYEVYAAAVTGSVLIPLCTLAAAYAALASHSWAAYRSVATGAQCAPTTGMRRLDSRELGVLVGTLLTLWFYYVPVHFLLPLSDECVGSCRRFLRSSSFSTQPVDLSDDQWRSFRESAPLMLALALGHVLLSRLARLLLAPQARHAALASFSVTFLLVAHGGRALIPLALAGANFCLSRACTGSGAPVAAWLLGMGALLLKEFAREQLSFTRLAGAAAAPLDRQMIGWCASSAANHGPRSIGGGRRVHAAQRAARPR